MTIRKSLEEMTEKLRDTKEPPRCPKHKTEMIYIYLGSGKFEWMCDKCLGSEEGSL